MTVVVLTTPGSGTWTVPAGLTTGSTVEVEAWGAGAGASGRNGTSFGAGGGGGAYAQSLYTLTPHDVASGITYVIGSGSVGTNNSNPASGTPTSFSTNNLNIIPYSTASGAATGSPGTLPGIGDDQWSVLTDGVTQTVTSVGIDSTTGFEYVSINWNGNVTEDTQFLFATSSTYVMAVHASTNYAFNMYLSTDGGSTTNVGTIFINTYEADNTMSFLTTTQVASVPIGSVTSTPTQFGGTFTSTSATAFVLPFFAVTTASTYPIAINFTVRVQGPQFEPGTSASFYKSTPGYTLADSGRAPAAAVGGVGGATANSSGSVSSFAGGAGAAFNANGSGGGGAGGPDGVGGVGTTAGVGGHGDSASGGAGGAVKTTTPGNVGAANVLGGGGGGALKTATAGVGGAGGLPGGAGGAAVTAGTATGGAGAGGQLRLTYTSSANHNSLPLMNVGWKSVLTLSALALIRNNPTTSRRLLFGLGKR